MKIFKLILNCVLPTLLVFSIVLNILLLCGFEFNKKSEDTESIPTIAETEDYVDPNAIYTEDYYDYYVEDYNPSIAVKDEAESENKNINNLIYQDDNITITYIESEKRASDIIHKFNIKNTSKKTLTVITSELYLNGQRVYVSGLTCEKLLPATDSTEELVLLEKEWSQLIEYPSGVSFKIKLVNDKSHLDLYETDLITLKF
jgi:hypothetical protein